MAMLDVAVDVSHTELHHGTQELFCVTRIDKHDNA